MGKFQLLLLVGINVVRVPGVGQPHQALVVHRQVVGSIYTMAVQPIGDRRVGTIWVKSNN
jgi:hypothetical protein